MKDFISRQTAIDAFDDTTYTKNEIRRRLEDIPAEDVRENVYGWWRQDEQIKAVHICSVCKKPQYGFRTKYCPHCGSIVGGKNEGVAEESAKD